MSFEAPIEVLLMAAQWAAASEVKVVIDPSPPQKIPDELFRLIHAIRPNSREAEALTGIKVRNRATAIEAARTLQQRGIEIVSVQAGGEGNAMLWGKEEQWARKIEVEAIDATGAGDAFVAALAVAIVENQTPSDALKFCNAAAALTTTKLGAQPALPTRKEIEGLMK
jgi:ribokinase